MSWRPWLKAFREALLGDVPVLAAGVALFAVIATIPGLAAIVALYSLVADPADIAGHFDGLARVFPDAVVEFVIAQLQREAARSSGELGLAVATTLIVALYSARSAADAMIVGLNRIYGVVEERHPLRAFLVALAVAVVTLLGVFALIAIVVALPAIVAVLHLGPDAHTATALLRWPILLVVVALGLVALYRHAPSPRARDRRRLWPGALVATAVWLGASVALSFWVGQIADYENVYGAFASVLVLILWFYVSALSVLVGGLVNAELERADAGQR